MMIECTIDGKGPFVMAVGYGLVRQRDHAGNGAAHRRDRRRERDHVRGGRGNGQERQRETRIARDRFAHVSQSRCVGYRSHRDSNEAEVPALRRHRRVSDPETVRNVRRRRCGNDLVRDPFAGSAGRRRGDDDGVYGDAAENCREDRRHRHDRHRRHRRPVVAHALRAVRKGARLLRAVPVASPTSSLGTASAARSTATSSPSRRSTCSARISRTSSTRASRQTAGAFTSTEDGGSIGEGVLKRFNMVYDYPNGRMVAWPSKYRNEPDAFVAPPA